jgi:hypothetical protein
MADENVSTSGEVTSTPTTPTAAPASAAPAAAPATSSATPAGATPSTPEIPQGYVPSFRIRETREAALREAQSQYSTREAAVRAEADNYRRQVLALTGVTPPANPEIQAVRNQFGELYPGLSKLEERAAQLEQLLERSGDLQSQSDHYWTSYGRQTMDRLFEHASASLGSPLTEEGKSALHSAFTGFVSSSPELTARYANDPTLVEDFWKAFTSNFIDPARRAASANVQQRANVSLPQDTSSGIPPTAPPPQLKSLDERVAAGWTQFQQMKQR